jgi:hypothetical protein
MVRIKRLLAAVLVFATPGLAFATAPRELPEPETLALLGIGAVAIMIARWRNKK